MIVGSYASSYWGRPRATQDADILLIWQPRQVDYFVSKLGANFYADAQDLKDGLAQGRMSNIIHKPTGFKMDMSTVGGDPYFRQAFERRKPVELFTERIYFASAEDVILTKLLWASQGKSQRQIEDAAGIIEVQGHRLEKVYMKHWAEELHVSHLLEKILP